MMDPTLNALGKKLIQLGLTSNRMTFIGLICGLSAILSIIFHHYYLAASLMMANRLADGLDGAIARHSQLTDFGGFLDIVCDFIIYAGVMFAFGITYPEHLLFITFLIFSFIGPMTSFLAYAIIASKRQVTTQKRGKKSFYYLGGICEGTETAAVLILCCFMPQYLSTISIIFGCLCWLTTAQRIYHAWNDFGGVRDALKADSF